MKKLNLKSFKAHKELEINFDDKSFLLYGDNGAGKSSIYDALKIEFFEDKLFKAFSFTPEERDEKLRESKRLFNNKDLNNDFEINLEKDMNREHQVFMLDLKDTEFEQYLNLNYLVT